MESLVTQQGGPDGISEADIAKVQGIIDEVGTSKGSLIAILQQTQEALGWVPQAAVELIAKRLNAPVTTVYGVATFYSQFYLTRRGRRIIRLCDGTACHVKGARRLISTVEQELGIKAGETTPDYGSTVEVVYCLGACAISPVVVINGQPAGRMTPARLQTLLKA